MKITKNKVAIGLSGGVDSAVSAALLKEQGYEVTGVYLECWRAPGCRTEEDRKDALKVALHLGIPFKAVDFRKEYREKVVGYFVDEYKAGRTPNPDVMCNKEIKFGLFYEWAMRQGFDYVATGHYARVATRQQLRSLGGQAGHYARIGSVDSVNGNFLDRRDVGFGSGEICAAASTQLVSDKRKSRDVLEDKGRKLKGFGVNEEGVSRASRDRTSLRVPLTQIFGSRFCLMRGADEGKDQSYFLYQLQEKQLKKILFPIGEMTKNEVREKARELKLPVAQKPDSQGICFIGEVRVKEFLMDLGLKEIEGEVVDRKGRAIGKHKGVWFYTVGERHGFNLDKKRLATAGFDPTKAPVLYVVEKEVDSNRLVVGERKELLKDKFEVKDIHWVNQDAKNKIPEMRKV